MQNSPVSQKGSARIAGYLSQSKLSNLLVGLIFFFSATQLGYHFWPLSSLVYGIRIDYLSPTIYFLDILIVLFLALRTLLNRNSRLQVEKGSAAAERRVLVGITPILLINLLYSINPLATLSWSFHFVLYYLFLVALAPKFRSFGGLQQSARQIGTFAISSILTLSLLFQTILATTQVFLGHSVGGLLYYIGERNVSVGSPGIALGTFMDNVVLRAYGTFSHPNILAGWSVIVLLMILFLSAATKRSDLVGCKPNQKPTRSDLKVVILPLLLTTILVFLAQSRSAALSLFGFIIPFYLIKKTKLRTLFLYSILLLTGGVYMFSSTTRNLDLSASQRLDLQAVSLKVIQVFPTFGTGANASISSYPFIISTQRLLQPDHNSFTLFFSWFGLFGVLALFAQFRSLRDFRRVIGTFATHTIHLLPLLLLDHYLLTSPQGLFILLTYLAVAVNYSHVKENI